MTQPPFIFDSIVLLSEAIDAAFKPMFCSTIVIRQTVNGEVKQLERGVLQLHRFTPGNVELSMQDKTVIVLPFPFGIHTNNKTITFDYNVDLIFEPTATRNAFTTRHARHSSKYLNTTVTIEATDDHTR